MPLSSSLRQEPSTGGKESQSGPNGFWVVVGGCVVVEGCVVGLAVGLAVDAVVGLGLPVGGKMVVKKGEPVDPP